MSLTRAAKITRDVFVEIDTLRDLVEDVESALDEERPDTNEISDELRDARSEARAITEALGVVIRLVDAAQTGDADDDEADDDEAE